MVPLIAVKQFMHLYRFQSVEVYQRTSAKESPSDSGGSQPLSTTAPHIPLPSEARGVLMYRLFRFSFALNELFSSNYAHWMTNRNLASSPREVVRISEHIYLTRDMLELLSPDAEVSGLRKLAAADRMGSSYKCLAVPAT